MATERKTLCMFVPPHVTNQLAKSAPDEMRQAALATAHQSKVSRARRAAKAVSTDSVAAASAYEGLGASAPATGTSERMVYNCQNQWVQRVTLARGEGDDATDDADVDNIYVYAGAVLDYYKKQLNRDSIDNLGMNAVLNVHYGTNYMNAFWDGDEMTFGDGDGTIFTSFAKSLDVVAHELGHGVTQFTSDLDYYSQSGALNEHFSDVFGAVITQVHNNETPGTADWLIGDEIMGPELYGEALRSMRAPGTAYDHALLGKDPQPAHMDDYYSGPADNRGVHINSGIPNRAFYIVARELDDTVAAARIWYHALQNLWPTAVFTDAAEVIAESARILIKNGKLPAGTTQIVRSAFREVGIVT